MKTTAAKFVSAIFATIIASSTLTAAPEAENEDKEKPAETCLLGPSASTPPGGHWYYRADRANKRNCWYLGDAKDKGARKQVAEEDSVAVAKPAAPAPKKPAAQRSITDARAELPQTPVEPDTRNVATPQIPAAPADAQRAVATRWPEPAAISPPAPSAAPPAPVARVAETQPQSQPQTQPTAAAPPRPAAAPAPIARTNAAADKPLSLPMQLTILAGGLSVIGVMASIIFARGKSQQGKPRPRRRLSRSAPMPPLQTPPEKPVAEKPVAEQPLPEDSRAPDDPTRRLQQMLADIQKRAAA